MPPWLHNPNRCPQRGQGFDQIAKRIYSFDQVTSCYLMSGGYDLMVIIEDRSLMAVAKFVAEKIAPLDSVLSTRTHFILRKYKMNGHQLMAAPQDQREAVVL
jgi:DNA-binding Lrp family transcriptional regulator